MKAILDGYGVGVRAGVFTPQKEDEEFFRTKLSMPAMSPDVDGAWAEDGGFRRPITLRLDGDTDPAATNKEVSGDND